MTEKLAYQFDHAGIYQGTTAADESPLEPGVFLLPARCTFKEPPTNVSTGKVPRWNGSGWAMVNNPANASGPEENPLAKLQAFLMANPDVAALVTTGGV
jgi:hypothetical protein